MEQTRALSGFGVIRFTSASSSACFLCPFPSSGATWLSDLLIPRHFQRIIMGKLAGVDLGTARNLQRRKFEVTR